MALSTFGVKDWSRGHHPVGATGVLDSRNHKRQRRPRYILHYIIGGKGALIALNHRCPRYMTPGSPAPDILNHRHP